MTASMVLFMKEMARADDDAMHAASKYLQCTTTSTLPSLGSVSQSPVRMLARQCACTSSRSVRGTDNTPGVPVRRSTCMLRRVPSHRGVGASSPQAWCVCAATSPSRDYAGMANRTVARTLPPPPLAPSTATTTRTPPGAGRTGGAARPREIAARREHEISRQVNCLAVI